MHLVRQIAKTITKPLCIAWFKPDLYQIFFDRNHTHIVYDDFTASCVKICRMQNTDLGNIKAIFIQTHWLSASLKRVKNEKIDDKSVT